MRNLWQLVSLQVGRGLAAVMVVGHTMSYIGREPRYWQRVSLASRFNGLQLGVEYFFVLSGVVMLMAHWGNIDLPPLVPVAPSISDSYFVGYSNRAGVMLLLFFLVLGIHYRWRFGARTARVVVRMAPELGAPTRVSRERGHLNQQADRRHGSLRNPSLQPWFAMAIPREYS
jgi:hypothetical protein